MHAPALSFAEFDSTSPLNSLSLHVFFGWRLDGVLARSCRIGASTLRFATPLDLNLTLELAFSWRRP